MTTVLTPTGSLPVVAVLVPLLPYSWLMLNLPNTKVKAVTQGIPLKLMVSYLSRECLKKNFSVTSLMVCLKDAMLTLEMTTLTTLGSLTSHR